MVALGEAASVMLRSDKSLTSLETVAAGRSVRAGDAVAFAAANVDDRGVVTVVVVRSSAGDVSLFGGFVVLDVERVVFASWELVFIGAAVVAVGVGGCSVVCIEGSFSSMDNWL